MNFKLIICLVFVAAGGQFVLGNETPAILSVSLHCGDTNYPWEKNTSCIFELRNNGNDNIFVLHWFTPLRGLNSNCLKVTRNGKNVRYDGKLAKRFLPAPIESFIKIDAGTSVTADFDLSDGYSTSKPGTYTVSVDIFSLQYYHENSLKYKTTHLQSHEVIFTVKKTAIQRLTMGEKQRISEVTSRSNTNVGSNAGEPLDAIVTGTDATAARKELIAHAHRAGYFYMQASSLEVMEDEDHFKLLFGNDLNNRVTVQGIYDNIVTHLESKIITYQVFGKDCTDEYAYTSYKSNTIFFCKALLDLSNIYPLAPNAAYDSITGAIIHELSHAVSDTGDHEYGWEDAKKLAKDNIKLAIDNADNYEYFSQTTYPFNFGIDAITVLPNGWMYMLKDNFYARIGKRGEEPFALDSKYPELMYNHWGSLTGDFKKGFDSILNCGDSSFTYATKGNLYIRYSDTGASTIDSGYPISLSHYWGNINPSFRAGFDSGSHLPNGATYVTKDKYYIKYRDSRCEKVYQQPISISEGYWGDLPQAFDDGFDAIMASNSGKTFVTKGKQYVRYSDKGAEVVDPGYPKNIRGQFGKVKYS